MSQPLVDKRSKPVYPYDTMTPDESYWTVLPYQNVTIGTRLVINRRERDGRIVEVANMAPDEFVRIMGCGVAALKKLGVLNVEDINKVVDHIEARDGSL